MTEITAYFLRQEGRSSDLLLRTAAAAFSGLDPAAFETVREYGKKPRFLRHPELSASVSHSGGIWAAAFSWDGEIGLDIQLRTVSPRRDRIAERFFHPREAEAVRSSPDPDSAFSRIWCRKEAAVKLSGAGIDGRFSSFDVTSPGPADVFGEAVHLVDFSLPNLPALFACAAYSRPFSVRPVPLPIPSEL